MDGFLNIMKPTGMTSHDVVAVVRKLCKTKKVGHTGTLDPNAAGVLPICIGRATKFSDYLLKEKKRYFARIRLGYSTDTLDSYGTVEAEKEVSSFDEQRLIAALKCFEGHSKQIPPKYSAIKIGGKKLYELARSGEELPERKSRDILIEELKLCFFTEEEIAFDVLCSAGTYIRSLAYDIGRELNNEAYLSLLIRTRSGSFSIEDAVTLEELEEIVSSHRCTDVLIPIEQALQNYGKAVVSENKESLYRNGATVRLFEKHKKEGIYRVYNEQGTFLGLGEVMIVDDRTFIKSLKLAVIA